MRGSCCAPADSWERQGPRRGNCPPTPSDQRDLYSEDRKRSGHPPTAPWRLICSSEKWEKYFLLYYLPDCQEPRSGDVGRPRWEGRRGGARPALLSPTSWALRDEPRRSRSGPSVLETRCTKLPSRPAPLRRSKFSANC